MTIQNIRLADLYKLDTKFDYTTDYYVIQYMYNHCKAVFEAINKINLYQIQESNKRSYLRAYSDIKSILVNS